MNEWRDLSTAPKHYLLEFAGKCRSAADGEWGTYHGEWYSGTLHTMGQPRAWRPLPLERVLELCFPLAARERCESALVEEELARLRARYKAAGLA